MLTGVSMVGVPACWRGFKPPGIPTFAGCIELESILLCSVAEGSMVRLGLLVPGWAPPELGTRGVGMEATVTVP